MELDQDSKGSHLRVAGMTQVYSPHLGQVSLSEGPRHFPSTKGDEEPLHLGKRNEQRFCQGVFASILKDGMGACSAHCFSLPRRAAWGLGTAGGNVALSGSCRNIPEMRQPGSRPGVKGGGAQTWEGDDSLSRKPEARCPPVLLFGALVRFVNLRGDLCGFAGL